MSDMITAEAADFAWPVGGYAPGGYMCKCSTCGKTHMAEKRAWQCADCVIQRLHAQLADAKAAQAMMVERAAGHIVSEGERLAEGIPNAGPGLEFLRELADEVRALADTDGVALVQALRAERDELAKVIDDTESHYGLSSNGNMWRFWSDKAREIAGNNTELRADRDRLAAANAALEAQVARLVGALHDAYAHQVAACAEWKAEMAKARGVAKHKMLAARYAGHHAAMNDLAKRIAALADVQADARREGGE